MLLCENKVLNFHIKQNYRGGLYYTQKLQGIKCETIKTYTLYSTPAKAWENVDVARSRPYMWSGCEQRKRMATNFYP